MRRLFYNFIKQIDLAKTLQGIYFLEIETVDGTVKKDSS